MACCAFINPTLAAGLDADSRRHRFFVSQRIDLESARAVEDMVIKALIRQSRTIGVEGVTSLEDGTASSESLESSSCEHS